MSTIEERLQALEREHQTLEREHTDLKKTIELQTIAIGALVTKATLEKLNEKYDKIFDALMAHDRLTNERLGDIQTQLIEQDGKIVGLQTEMRQRFNEQDSRIARLDSKVTGLDSKVAGLDSKVTGLDSKVAGLDSKVTGLDSKVAGLDSKVAGLQTTQAEHTVLLQQILNRLPEK
jgi:chromosome segregation ATPase